MRGSGTDHQVIDGLKGADGTVGVDDGDLRPERQCDARPVCDGCIDFDGGDFAFRPDEFGKNGGVIASAAAEMKDMIVAADAKPVKVGGPETGLAVVDSFGCVE